MRVASQQEIESVFSISSNQLDEWEEDATRGVLHGDARGEVLMGRPRIFVEETRQVGFREPISVIAEIDARARQLGMRRSDYLRHLVEADLAAVRS